MENREDGKQDKDKINNLGNVRRSSAKDKRNRSL